MLEQVHHFDGAAAGQVLIANLLQVDDSLERLARLARDVKAQMNCFWAGASGLGLLGRGGRLSASRRRLTLGERVWAALTTFDAIAFIVPAAAWL